MDFAANLVMGLQTVADPTNLMFCLLGVFIGTAVGILPGLGPMGTIAILLPLTYQFSPEAAIIMLAGVYYGAQYGGSTTAILINLPGEASSAVTAIDGYQLALKGKAGLALATAAIGSFVAGTIATLAIAVFSGVLTSVAVKFGPPDYFALMVFGLVASIALAHGSMLKGLVMITLGLLLGTVGTDVYSGSSRYTFGAMPLTDGISIVAFAAGIYAVSEMLRNLEIRKDQAPAQVVSRVDKVMMSRKDMKEATMPILRGTLIGSFLGILPGGGAMLSSFVSYATEKKISRHPEEFGHGALAGVAGPESANNAGAQTSFIPMLALGIPSNPLMALMIGALLIQGISPGPNLATQQPALFWGVIVSMWVGNLMLLALNLPLIGLWIKLVDIPQKYLMAPVLIFASIGVFSVSSNEFDLYLMAGFGVLGYVLHKLECEPAPLLLGFVLGPMLEQYLRRSMLMSHGDGMVFFQRPISASILALSVLVLVIMVLPAIRKRRKEVFVEEN